MNRQQEKAEVARKLVSAIFAAVPGEPVPRDALESIGEEVYNRVDNALGPGRTVEEFAKALEAAGSAGTGG